MINSTRAPIVSATIFLALTLTHATPALAQFDQLLRGLTAPLMPQVQPIPPSYPPPTQPSYPQPPQQYRPPPTYSAPATARPSASTVRGSIAPAPPKPLARPAAGASSPRFASFDCNLASTATERLICAEPRLGQLDQEVSSAYLAARAAQSSDSGGLMMAQRAWLRQRDACDSDTRCLEQSMTTRLAELRASIPASSPLLAGAASSSGNAGPDIAPSSGPPLPAALPVPTAAGGQGTSASIDDATKPWRLPLAQGLPVLDVRGANVTIVDAKAMWEGSDTPPRQPEAESGKAWARLLRLLRLRSLPLPPGQPDDITAWSMACALLSRRERAEIFGSEEFYGRDTHDVCEMLIAGNPSDPKLSLNALTAAHRLAIRDGAARFREQALPRLIQAAPDLPLRLILRWPAELGVHDTTLGGYPVRGSGFSGSIGRLWGTPLDTVSPSLWPISEADAARLERSRNGRRPTYYFGMPLTIVGVMQASSGAPDGEDTGLPNGVAWRFVEGPVSLYADEALTQKLHSFESDVPAAPAIANESDAIANAKAAAAQWKLATRQGLPVLPDGTLQSANSGAYDNSSLALPRAIYALGLAQAPTAREAMKPAEVLGIACLFLPPSRAAQLGAAQPCNRLSGPFEDEFRQRDHAAEFRSADLPKILAAAPRLPMQVLVLKPLRLKQWDEAKGGFPFEANIFDYNGLNLLGSRLPLQMPDFWPASQSVARAFIESRSTAKASTAPLWLAVRLTITGVKQVASSQADPNLPTFSAHTGLPRDWLWQFEAVDVTLYADEAITTKLYAFGTPITPPTLIPGAGTRGARAVKPDGPVPFDGEALLLATLRDAGSQRLPIDWSKAAQSRFAKEDSLRQRLDWRRFDAWGFFFAHAPDAQSIDAYRDWSERRAQTRPQSFVVADIPAYPAAGIAPRSITVFDAHQDPAWSAASGIPVQAISADEATRLAPALATLGMAPTQLVRLTVGLPGTDLPLFGVLPRPRQDYQLNLRAGVPAQRIPDRGNVMSGSVMDIEWAVDGVQPLLIGNNGQPATVLLAKLQPISARLRVLGDNLVVASVTFPPSGWPDTGALPASAGLTLDSSLLDLLAAKFVGNQLSPEALAYIVLRRWEWEHAAGLALNSRFFSSGQQRPTPEEAAARGPEFVAWASTHSPSTPVRVVRTETVTVRKDQPIHWWAMNTCFRASPDDMGLRSQQRDCERVRAGNAIATDTGPNAERRCAAIDAVVALGDFMQVLNGQCAAANAMSGSGISFADPLQRRLFIPHALPFEGVKFLGQDAKFTLTVALDIKGATLSTTQPAAADRLPAEAIAAFQPSTQRETGKEFIVFDTDFISARYNDASGRQLRDFGPDQGDSLDGVISRFRARKAAIAQEIAAASKPPEGPYGPDLLGIRLGMDFVSAEALIRAHMEVGRVLDGRRAFDPEFAQGFNKPLDSGKLFISADGHEMIALIDEPPAVKERVLAAWRRVLIKSGTIVPAEVFAGLEQKYGKPDGGWKPQQINQWHGREGALCTQIYQYGRSVPLGEVWYEQGHPARGLPGEPPPLPTSAALPSEIVLPDGTKLSMGDIGVSRRLAAAGTMTSGTVRAPTMPELLFKPLDLASEAGGGRCGPFVAASLWTGEVMRQPTDQLDITLTDIGPYLRAYAESRKTLTPAASQPGATAGGGAPIKF